MKKKTIKKTIKKAVKKKPTSISLKENESALVFTDEGGITVYIPEPKNLEEPVSGSSLLAVLISTLISKKKLDKLIAKEYDLLMKECEAIENKK